MNVSPNASAVTFPNNEGHRLFGILHHVGQPRPADTAILLLSPGVKGRVAPHRLYKKMADRFVTLGFPVLRFDFHGLGDSEGEAPDALLADLYGATQVGRYVPDAIAAMDWMQQRYGIARFIAAGLCGGALTGLLAAQRDRRVVGLLGLSIPVILDGSNIDFTKYMTTTQLKGTRNRYFGKFRLWDPDVWRSWRRFFTFQSHYSLIVRSILKPLRAGLQGAARRTNPDTQPGDNTNPHFLPAFRAMTTSSRPIFLAFAEGDRLWYEFEQKFLARHGEELQASAGRYEVHVTKEANHIFSNTEWQQDVLEQSSRWLQRHRTGAPADLVGAVN